MLAGQLRLLRIPCELRTIHAAELLERTLEEGARESDVIHLSTHGNKDGIGFTDGSGMNWNQLQYPLLKHAGGKLLVINACQSAAFVPDGNLAKIAQAFTKGRMQAARCVFTMFGDVYFADSVLAWGLFYRRMSTKLKGASSSQSTPEQIKDSLDAVHQAGLPKICAAFWYEEHSKYKNISPWHPEFKKKLVSQIK